MVSHLIGKGHRGLSKLCSAMEIAPAVSDIRFTEHMNFLESIALELRLENMKSAGESAKCLMQKEYGVDSTIELMIDLPASFDAS